ncbi:MAG: LysR family transcriptional regulator, partial [Atopobiaceae bacterium]|nr:LysR family transcriptional regulator [Atopobiaceae bacterium]
MELRELRSFLAVVRAGSVTHAAEELHITQPALSRQIAGLERELGCTLLERGRYGAVPTEEGMLLVRRAETLIELANKTEDELRAASS